jgi:hypothetical protein
MSLFFVGSMLADLSDIDRQNLAAAKLFGIMTDLNIDSTQFATAISILYGVCYGIAEPVS